MSISVDLWPQPAVKITSTTSTHPRLAPLCSRFLQTSPCLTELFKAVYFPSVYTIFRLIFSLSLSLPFFSFLKKKIRLHQGSELVNHSIQGSFPVNQPPRFLFFHLVQWTGYQIMAANASRHKPSPLFSDIQNNDISPSHPLRSSRALVPTECLLYGDPFISHTASLPPENTPVYAVTPQTQTQNSPNREREANGLYFSFLRVNRLVIYHGINMPDMFMKAVISRSKKFPTES